jgi:hypothetical protein
MLQAVISLSIGPCWDFTGFSSKIRLLPEHRIKTHKRKPIITLSYFMPRKQAFHVCTVEIALLDESRLSKKVLE